MDPSEELTRSTAAATLVYCKVGGIDVCRWEAVASAFDNGDGGTLVSHSELVRDSAAGPDNGFNESVNLGAVRGCSDFVRAVSLSVGDGVSSGASDEEDKSGEMHSC